MRGPADLLPRTAFIAHVATQAVKIAAFRKFAVALAATTAAASSEMASKVVKSVSSLGFPFKTPDPWLFAVYHKDDFPAGDDQMRVPGGKRGNGACMPRGLGDLVRGRKRVSVAQARTSS